MSNYKRQQFDSGITQNVRNNFARFDRAVQLRQQLRERTEERMRANAGVFTPDTLTTEVHQKFGGLKQKLQSLVTDKGLANAPLLDKKSDYFNNAVEANYNATKQSATDGLKAMNKAMTAYSEYMKAYKENTLNFNEEEYESIQGKWAQINDFVNQPERLGFDENGNITIAVYNEETQEDDQVPLAQWDALNFEAALKPVAEPDYTENFIGYLGSNPEDWNIATQDAIQRAGGRNNPNFLGMVSDYIESQYGENLPGHDDMVNDPRYQQEAIDRAIEFAKNRKTERTTGGGQSKPKPASTDDIDKLLKIPSAVLSPLSKNRDGSLKDDSTLRRYIQDKIARGVANTYSDEFRTFMDTQGFRGKPYTAQDLEDAWVEYTRAAMVEQYEDPNIASAAAGGVTEEYQDKVVKGGVTKQVPAAVPTSSIGVAEGRYNSDDVTYKEADNEHFVTLTDPTGMGHFAYDLEGSSSGGNFFSVTTNITPFNGAIQIGQIGKDEDGGVDPSFPHQQSGEVTFTPTQILNNIPVLRQDFIFDRFSPVGKSRTFFGFEGDRVPGYNLKPGAILTDDLVALIKEKHPKDWKKYIGFTSAAKGNAVFSEDRKRTTREMLVPLNQIQAQLQENTGHNFANMTDPEYNLQNLSSEQLQAVMQSNMYSDEYRDVASRLLGLD